jgi:hypothetical protein
MKKTLLPLLLVLSVIHLPAQPALQWQICLGGSANDYAMDVQQTKDNGYIVAGYTTSNDGDVTGKHGAEDMWLVKLDFAGVIQWQKCLGGTDSEQAHSVDQTTDGGYIVAGHTLSDDFDVSGNHGQEDFWVVKVNSSGTIQWQRCLGGTGRDFGKSVKQTSDGGYIVAGYTNSNDGDVSGHKGLFDYWVVKLDANGNLQWQKCFGGTDNDYATSVDETSAGTYIVAGHTVSNDGDVNNGNNGLYDSWVIELSSTGNLINQNSMGGSGQEFTHSVSAINSGNRLVAGSTGSNNGDVSGNHNTNGFGFEWDQWIVLQDISGNIIWQKCLGGTDQDIAYSATQTYDGGFVIGGNAMSNNGDVMGNHGSSDFWLVKLEANGNIVWQKCLGGSGFEMARASQQTNDGGYIMAGFTSSNDGDVSGNHGLYDAWVVKLLSSTTPLPVELINFTGEQQSGYNILKWATMSEKNNDYFIVLRSIDGENFESIGEVKGAGNSTQLINYSLIDKAPFAGINFYKLQQTDFDGESSFSNIIAINNSRGKMSLFIIYPNPVTEKLNIESSEFNIQRVDIYNLIGKNIFSREFETQNSGVKTSIDVSGWNAGIYFVQIQSQDLIDRKQVVVRR